MHRNMKAVFTAALVATTAACSESAFEPVTADYRPLMDLEHAGPSYMSNYVAIGTSLTSGWTADGIHSGLQADAWPVQLANRLHTPFTYPAIMEPGCQPPFAAPLLAFQRIDGSSALADRISCSANEAGVTLPTQNLAVENATAFHALTNTPENAQPANRRPITSRILPSGMTQVSTMVALNPSIVSVEFGGNEILPAQAGILIPGHTFTPFASFKANYQQIIDAVKSTGARALLVSIRTDLRNFPAIRTGPEIAAQREAFAQYNVAVSTDCDASENYLFVRGIVPTAILTGKAMRAYGVPYVLSCANKPLDPSNPRPDYVLSPAEIGFVNALAEQMSDEIERHAAENGYATFPLGVLYNIAKDGVPFDLGAYLNSDAPYGELISLDGVHPSAKGHAIFARAAAHAIRKTYGENGDGIGGGEGIN